MKKTFLKGQPVRVTTKDRRRRHSQGIVVRYEYGKVVVLFLDGRQEAVWPEEMR